MNDLDATRAQAILDRHAERLLRCARAILTACDGEGPHDLVAARDALAEYIELRARPIVTETPSNPPPRAGTAPTNPFFANAYKIAREPWGKNGGK